MRTFLLLAVLATLAVSGCVAQPAAPELPTQPEQPPAGPAYRFVTEKPAGWFTSGQPADIVLYATAFNETTPLLLNHPGKVALAGGRLLVADAGNNRVLVWNAVPTADNQLPDLVLGQLDFTANAARLGPDGMNWPMGIASDGGRLLVADAFNYRILVWNSFPTRNGQSADLVLGQPDFWTWRPELAGVERDPTTGVYWPWEVWTDGNRVAATSHEDGTLLVWSSFPAKNNQPADLVLAADNFSFRFTPTDRSRLGAVDTGIASDGARLVTSSYNQKSLAVWDRFPAQSGTPPTFTIDLHELEQRLGVDNLAALGTMGAELAGGKLFATATHKILVWDPFPANASQLPRILGADRVRMEGAQRQDLPAFFRDSFNRPFGIASDGVRLAIADTNNNRVLIYNTVPAATAEADVVLGEPERFASRRSFVANPAPFSDGERLLVGVDGYGLWLYDRLPDESRAPADILLGLLRNGVIVGGPAITVGEKIVMVHREGSSVFIWNSLPTADNQPPDVVLGKVVTFEEWGSAGSGHAALDNPVSAASDGTRLFVVDQGNNRVLIWNALPAQNQTLPDLVLGQPDFASSAPGAGLGQLDSPVQVATDGARLAVADQANNRVLVWSSLPSRSSQPADFEMKIVNHSAPIGWAGIPQHARLTGVAGVALAGSRLFVSDPGNNRVLGWSAFPQSEADEPDLVLGQKDFVSSSPSNAADGLFVPALLSFDGSFLWVGETKWSQRLLRFSVSA